MGWIGQGAQRITTETLIGRMASKAATVLERLGVGAGDGVALYMRNDITFFEASIATGMLGAYPVPVNWHYTPDEAQYLLADSGVKVLVIHADLLPPIAAVVPPGVTILVVEVPPDMVQAYGLAADTGLAQAGATLWRALVDAAPERQAPPAAAAPNSIIYTSGTTGRPKGVRRPAYPPEAQALVSRMLGLCYGYTEVLQGQRDPSTVTTAVIGPMYHAAPNAHGLFSARMGINVLVEPRFDAERLLALIERERITHLNMVPVMFVRLLKLPDEVKRRYDLSSLEYVAHAAAPCPPEVKRAMIDWWGPVIWEYYGSTEMGNVTHLSSQEWLAHPGSVGRVIAGLQVRILDEQGHDLPHGAVGEVAGGSPLLTNFTYQNAPAKRAEMDRSGLVAPGDIGYFDADGYLYLCDRKNQMIISGGANIYPAEIEAELHKLPGVADCAVFGIPDDEFGEAVCAYVQPDPGAVLDAGELRAALRKVMTSYKVPKVMEFTDALPREDSGKIFTRKLREPYWAGSKRSI
ncbi:MAG: acyl-CoA synthetase [Burkholderiales bacterium]